MKQLINKMIKNLSWQFKYMNKANDWVNLPMEKSIIDKAMSGTIAGIKGLQKALSPYPGVQIQVWVKNLGKLDDAEQSQLEDVLYNSVTALHAELGFQGNVTLHARTKKMKRQNTNIGITLNADESSTFTGGGLISRFMGEIVS